MLHNSRQLILLVSRGRELFTLGHNSRDLSKYSSYEGVDLPVYHRVDFDTDDEPNLWRAVSSHDGLQVFFRHDDCIVEVLPDTHVRQKSTVYCLDGNVGRITHIACKSAGVTAAAFYPGDVRTLCPDHTSAKLQILIFDSLSMLMECLADYPARAASRANLTEDTISKIVDETSQGHTQVLKLGIVAETRPDHDRVIKSMLATATGFVVLMAHGEMYTWGDGRYPHALGRPIDVDNPVNKPCLVHDLLGLGVKKIVTGGSMACALTEAGDAYIWGMPALGGGGFVEAQNNDLEFLLKQRQVGDDLARIILPSTPNVDDEPEVKDIALGDGHMLVLDATDRVWICGSNSHGQLGLDNDTCGGETGIWKRVGFFHELLQSLGKKPVEVHAGELSSFVMVEDA